MQTANLHTVLHDIATRTVNSADIDWTGFAKLGREERLVNYVSCFSNCLSTRSNCLSPTVLANIIETDGVPLAPIHPNSFCAR